MRSKSGGSRPASTIRCGNGSSARWTFDRGPAGTILPCPRHDVRGTDTEHAPWHIVVRTDKKRARLNCIAHLLATIKYKQRPRMRSRRFPSARKIVPSMIGPRSKAGGSFRRRSNESQPNDRRGSCR